MKTNVYRHLFNLNLLKLKRVTLLISPVTGGDSLHNECLLFFEQHPLPFFQTANAVPYLLHYSSYDLWIDSRRMLPYQPQHLLLLELFGFHGLDFLLNGRKSLGPWLLSFFLTSKFGPVSLCEIEIERSFYL